MAHGFFDTRWQPCFAPQAGHAASAPSSPGFDNGSVNEIFWYGTFGMIVPRGSLYSSNDTLSSPRAFASGDSTPG